EDCQVGDSANGTGGGGGSKGAAGTSAGGTGTSGTGTSGTDTGQPAPPGRLRGTPYKWLAPSHTTPGLPAAAAHGCLVIISLPAIFRGINLDPLTPGNISYLLWKLMGYLLVSAVLVVTLGRLGDIYGRVRMYNLGFAIFGLAALALPFDPFTGPSGALWLILWRGGGAVGGSLLMGHSPPPPPHPRPPGPPRPPPGGDPRARASRASLRRLPGGPL